MSNAVLKTEPHAIVACTISRDVQIFDLLIEDMETALGENWGDLSFDDAAAYLAQPEADSLGSGPIKCLDAGLSSCFTTTNDLGVR